MNNGTDDKLMAQAAKLSTEISPERDLWPDIAAAIETPRRRSSWTPYLAQAAAVVLLVGASSSITYMMTKSDSNVSPLIQTVGLDAEFTIDQIGHARHYEAQLAPLYAALGSLS